MNDDFKLRYYSSVLNAYLTSQLFVDIAVLLVSCLLFKSDHLSVKLSFSAIIVLTILSYYLTVKVVVKLANEVNAQVKSSGRLEKAVRFINNIVYVGFIMALVNWIII